jgi:hypothetical protein
MPLIQVTQRWQTPISPVKAVFVGIDTLLAVRPLNNVSTYILHDMYWYVRPRKESVQAMTLSSTCSSPLGISLNVLTFMPISHPLR